MRCRLTDLDLGHDLYVLAERHDLAVQALHGDDVLVALAELDAVDAGEELLQVRLDDGRVGRLAEDLQQVVVADEVEAREEAALLL